MENKFLRLVVKGISLYIQTGAVLFAFLFAVLFAGCSDKPKPQQAVSPSSPSGQTGMAVASKPASTQQEVKVEHEVYSYDSKDRRDPFIPLVADAKEKPQRKKGATAIEDFGVEEIRLIAIAWDSSQYYAMITLPDNKSYTIRKGMTLGLYGGKVEQITKDSVIISEQVKDYKGVLKTKETILKLRKEGV